MQIDQLPDDASTKQSIVRENYVGSKYVSAGNSYSYANKSFCGCARN